MPTKRGKFHTYINPWLGDATNFSVGRLTSLKKRIRILISIVEVEKTLMIIKIGIDWTALFSNRKGRTILWSRNISSIFNLYFRFGVLGITNQWPELKFILLEWCPIWFSKMLIFVFKLFSHCFERLQSMGLYILLKGLSKFQVLENLITCSNSVINVSKSKRWTPIFAWNQLYCPIWVILFLQFN